MARNNKAHWNPNKKADVQDLKTKITKYVKSLYRYKYICKVTTVAELKAGGIKTTKTLWEESLTEPIFTIKKKFKEEPTEGKAVAVEILYKEFIGVDKVPTMLNLATYLEVGKSTVSRCKDMPEFAAAFEIFQTISEAAITDNLIAGKGSIPGQIYYTKNHLGYSDDPENADKHVYEAMSEMDLIREISELQDKLGVAGPKKMRLVKGALNDTKKDKEAAQ